VGETSRDDRENEGSFAYADGKGLGEQVMGHVAALEGRWMGWRCEEGSGREVME